MSIMGDIDAKLNQAAESSVNTVSETKTIISDNQVVRRYQDSYTVARTANAFGSLTKTIGLVSAGIIGLIGLIMTLIIAASFSSSGIGFIVFLVAVVLGAIVGAIFYIFGIVLSALGQNLMATLDTAVHGSPFMTQEQKAQAMNLTK